LSDALQDIPVAVYWITASIIAAIGNIISVSDYTLSDSKDKLYFVDSKLKEPLNTAVDFQAKKTPETFNSSTDYKNSFMPPLLEGTHSDLYSNLLRVSHAPFCEVMKVERDNKQFKLPKSLFCQISFKSTKECNGKYEPEPGYLIAFTDIKPKRVNGLSKTRHLARNKLIGEIPRLLYWNEVLQYLGLRGNMLIGFLSPDICQLSSLWYFDVRGNNLIGSTLNGATKKKHLLYNHKPLFMFEDYYLRVCQFTKRKGANFQAFSNMLYMCEIGSCGLTVQTIVLCQTLDDDVIICIPLCSVDWYIARVFKIVRSLSSAQRHDSPLAKQLYFTQWEDSTCIRMRTRGRVLQSGGD